MSDFVRNMADLPVAAIAPSPYQPRRAFDPAALEELAASIRGVGLLQPVTVRKIDVTPEECPFRGKEIPTAGEGCGWHNCPANSQFNEPKSKQNRNARCQYAHYDWYELICGERRLRAAKLAGLTHVPAQVIEADDRTTAELVALENLQRADLNAIETAAMYRTLADMGMTQSQIAERLGVSQPSIANALRLLELPETVQDQVRAGTISGTMARGLLRWPSPLAQELLAKYALDNGWTTKQVEQSSLPDAVVKKLVAKHLAQDMPWYGAGKPLFDVVSTCGDCPHYRRQGLCFNPPCFQERQASSQAAIEERKEAAKAAIAALRTAPASLANGPASPDGSPSTPDVPAPVLLNDLPGDSYERIPDWLTTCRADCPQRVTLPRRMNDGLLQSWTVCLEPDCLRKLHADHSAAADASRKAQMTEAEEQLIARLRDAHADPRELLAVLVADALEGCGVEMLRALFAAWNLPLDAEVMSVASYHQGYDPVAQLEAAAALSLPDQVALLVAMQMRSDLQHIQHWGRKPGDTLHWLLDRAGAVAWREEQRRAAVEHPPESVDDEDGQATCPACDGAGSGCIECGDRGYVPADGYRYCPSCDGFGEIGEQGCGDECPDCEGFGVCPVGDDADEPVRTCRVCGCMDDDCSGCIERTGAPCSWVEEDLCSACVPLSPSVASVDMAPVESPLGETPDGNPDAGALSELSDAEVADLLLHGTEEERQAAAREVLRRDLTFAPASVPADALPARDTEQCAVCGLIDCTCAGSDGEGEQSDWTVEPVSDTVPEWCGNCRAFREDRKLLDHATGTKWGHCTKKVLGDAPISAALGGCPQFVLLTCVECRAWTSDTKHCTAKASPHHGPRASTAPACAAFRAMPL